MIAKYSAHLFLVFSICAALSGCVEPLTPAPESRSSFLEHREEMKHDPDRAPFMLIWVLNRELLDSFKYTFNKIHFAPVNLSYLEPNDPPVPQAEKNDAAKYLFEKFVEVFRKDEDVRYVVVDTPDLNTFTVELAIIKLVPTAKSVNYAVNVAGIFVPGGPAVSAASNFLGSAAGHEIGKGGIAIAFRIRDGATGEVLAEAYDERLDPAALILNVQDFTTWGNARVIMEEWSEEFLQLMKTPGSEKVHGPSEIRLFLW